MTVLTNCQQLALVKERGLFNGIAFVDADTEMLPQNSGASADELWKSPDEVCHMDLEVVFNRTHQSMGLICNGEVSYGIGQWTEL